jgi:hypothetical protein
LHEQRRGDKKAYHSSGGTDMPVAKLLTSKTAIFALGAASVAVLNAAIPIVGSLLRPIVKEVIKGGILAGRQIQTLAEEAWQDVEDIAAEAQAELNDQATDVTSKETNA